jgi:hypothetical protein
MTITMDGQMQNLAEQSKQAPLPRASQQPVASQAYTPADARRDTFSLRAPAVTPVPASAAPTQNA